MMADREVNQIDGMVVVVSALYHLRAGGLAEPTMPAILRASRKSGNRHHPIKLPTPSR
jgi:hypothetical protein